MGIILGEKAKGLAVAEQFAACAWWEPQNRCLISDDLAVTFPVAPPGMLQKLRPGEIECHMDWMTRTTSNWSWAQVSVFSTNFPDTFWIKRDAEANTHWAGKDGCYRGRLFTKIVVKKEKITEIRDYFDSLAMYAAAGIPIPTFRYDAPDPYSIPAPDPVPDVTRSEEALAAQTKATLSKFVSVDFWDGNINADDIVHELPFTPADMPRRYNAREYNALNMWIGENCLQWTTYPNTILYITDTPGIYIIESGGSGYMSWAGVKGYYQNREMSYLYIEDGYAKEFHEYFNPANKMNSVNLPLPTFPYLY